MNYRHAYHAGNAADVVKHALLCRALLAMARKDKPFLALDTHAGAGIFDLVMDERALRGGEWRGGVQKVLEDPEPHPLLAPWLEALDDLNADQPEPRFYPGSPWLMARLTRRDDRVLACELHPEEIPLLEAALKPFARARAHHMDGYGALTAFLPPPSRRGLILVDPPFERKDDYDRMVKGLRAGLKRFASGVWLLWRPIKATGESGGADAGFLEALRDCPAPVLDLRLDFAPKEAQGLTGTGMTVVNPPYGFAEEAAEILEWLTPRLAVEGFRGRWSGEWIRPEA